jgi:hypothetical protein
MHIELKGRPIMRRQTLSLSIFFFTFLLPVGSYGQQMDASASKVAELMVRLEDSNWENRKEAFFCLYSWGTITGYQSDPDDTSIHEPVWKSPPEYQEAIRLAFIKLLERETSFSQEYEKEYAKIGVPLGERYGEGYYAHVIEVVASFKDPRSIKGLLGAISTGGMAIRAVAQFGSDALDSLLEKLKTGDRDTRVSAVAVLGQMLKPGNYSKVSAAVPRQKIKDALIGATKDTDYFMRLMAVKGLANLGDRDVIPLFESLAAKGPFQEGESLGTYPVRKAAAEALKQIK